ncbi:MAG: M64 family metallo-endopeptidase [Verrucomicrobia bacterium]|nr:M64 family metallo-endopeptidase [Verrucomicrobiota bacterium]
MKTVPVLCWLLLPGLLTGRTLAQAAELFGVEEHGTRAQRLNLVFLSEGYTREELPRFADDVAAAVTFLFSKEPWQRYRSYCNIYRIEVASTESGCDNGDTGGPGVQRDTYFDTGFKTPGIPQSLEASAVGMGLAFALLNSQVPEYDIPIILVNDAKYGGAGDTITIVSTHPSGSAIVEHELGHSFALLADEYAADYPEFDPFEAPNNTAQTNRDLLRWNYWIDDDTPVPTPETALYDAAVGLFEGSMYHASGWYRPHYNSVMRSLNRPCGAVNREQFVLRYYARLSPLDDWFPATDMRWVTALEMLEFTVTPKVPDCGEALLTTWKIDAVEQLAASGNGFTTASENLGNGVHTVTATVRDPTGLVRRDPDGLLEDSVTWTLALSNQPPNNLGEWRDAYGDDLANPAGDGLQNLMKYALGLLPTAHAQPEEYPAGSLTHEATGSHLTLTVPRRARRPELAYRVEVSDDLVTWHSGWGHTVVLRDDESMLVVRDATPMTGAARRFIRLKVTAS